MSGLTIAAGVFTVGLGAIHIAIPRIVGFGAALDGAEAGGGAAPALPSLAIGSLTYRVRPADLIGIAWVMSNAASYVLITVGALDLAWASGWRGVPLTLGAWWIAGWWAVRAIGQFALGRRTGDVLAAIWFGALAAGHVGLAIGPG